MEPNAGEQPMTSKVADNASELADDANQQTPEEQAEAQRYGRVSLTCSLLDSAIDVAYLGVMTFVVARPLDDWLARFAALAGSPSYLRLVVLLVLVIAGHVLVSLPLSFFAGYVVEHRFGLSNQTLGRWLRNWSLRNVLAIVFGLVIYVGLFAIIWNTGAYWWLIAAAAFFVMSVVMGQLVPVLIMPLFQKIEKLDRPDLEARMTQLADGTGLTIEGVYRLGMSEDTKKANAMLAGLGATRRVLMGDTLLERFSLDEVDVIFAHEIGHHVYRHIYKMIATGAVLSLAGLWIVDRVLARWSGAGAASAVGSDALPLVMFTLTVFMLVLEPLQNFISRHYERQCDALQRTENRAAYRSAFMKLAKLNKAEMDPNPIEVFLFDSHPPIAERLAMAEE
jgi:STE24 endopeptidase